MLTVSQKAERLQKATKNFTIRKLARALQLSERIVHPAAFYEDDPDGTVEQALDALAEKLNLCPDCYSEVRREGGCVVCTCGWSYCT